MKCEECLVLVEDFIDGELDERAARRVSSHISVCETCASFSEQVRQEQDLYAHYQREVEVTPALWAGVQQRISRETPAHDAGVLARIREFFSGLYTTPRLSPAFAAALVVIAVASTVAVMSLVNSRNNGPGDQLATHNGNGATAAPEAGNKDSGDAAKQPGETGAKQGQDERVAAINKRQPEPASAVEKSPVKQPLQKRQAASPQAASPEQLVREAEQKYLAAINILSRDILSRDVDNRRSKMDPAVLARFTVAINDINNTIAETRRAARENPDDPVALQYMLTAYRKKVEVLREMARD